MPAHRIQLAAARALEKGAGSARRREEGILIERDRISGRRRRLFEECCFSCCERPVASAACAPQTSVVVALLFHRPHTHLSCFVVGVCHCCRLSPPHSHAMSRMEMVVLTMPWQVSMSFLHTQRHTTTWEYTTCWAMQGMCR